MAFSRYDRSPVLGFGTQYGTSTAHAVIRNAIKENKISYKEIILHESQRLDQLAGKYYQNARYWWIIAAASNIGWGLQVPPGTVIKIPDLTQIMKLIA